MDTTALKKFAQGARRQLLGQVSTRMEQVLRSDSVEIREKAKVVEQLKTQIEEHGKVAVIDRVAYIWFNRFCALRFMDVNRYTHLGAVSPVEGGTQPEILLEAKQGHVDNDLVDFVDRQIIFSLLNGQRPASDPQGEAYRLLLVGICKSYNKDMPFLFEQIEDYTELLMPMDLLSENSILQDLRDALTPEACLDVEVIGWLYQYYISERKDKVFEALKQNQKIEAGDIPAATQLFTPHWIVRYLVENSLGRLWMLNHPDSKLREKMEYYITPAQDETNFLHISSPEELRLLDPACGSGHILTYGFDLLYAIYEEEGYASSDIAKLILEKNIFGVEIDPRAGALAAFALVMKARAKDRRFFTRDVSPNICVLENVTFNDAELKQYMNAVGRDLFTEPLMETLHQFEQADNFGSLIRPMLTDAGYVRGLLAAKNLGGDMFYTDTHKKVLQVLKYAEFLTPRYHVVVANPPYMGGGNMGDDLKRFILSTYTDVKSDLFSAFIIRNLELSLPKGQLGFMTPFVWMFISSYEKLRTFLVNQKTITSLVQLEYSGFDGATVPICTFTLENSFNPAYLGGYIKLSDFKGAQVQSPKTIEAIKNPECGWFYRVSNVDFKKIPGIPIAYWASSDLVKLFELNTPLSDYFDITCGLFTCNNELFIRNWWEVSYRKTTLSKGMPAQWVSHAKGAKGEKWSKPIESVINFTNNGDEIRYYRLTKGQSKSLPGEKYFFRDGVSFPLVTSGSFSATLLDGNSTFDISSNSAFQSREFGSQVLLAALCSKTAASFLNILCPTLNFTPGDIGKAPFLANKLKPFISKIEHLANENVNISKKNSNFYEISPQYSVSPLLQNLNKLEAAYDLLCSQWKDMTLGMQQLEKENNRIFINAYGLQKELTPEVLLGEITLTCNPYYRYGSKKSEEELKALLLADTMKEFISYAVGCMFGRYSLNMPGLILASQGEMIDDFQLKVNDFGVAWDDVRFAPDKDNVIPVLEGEWFEDDIAERFKKFLRVTFGAEHYDENLAFIEEAIGRDVRSYFVKEFYKDHVQTYKKRPIYWMFSSPKGSFNALIYMHRYQPDTVSIVLNGYLREYIKKLTAHKSQLERTSVSGSASQSQKTKALKEITQVNKVLSELKEYEDEVLYPLATEQVKIDLDDGVKVNYGKFSAALSPIKGL